MAVPNVTKFCDEMKFNRFHWNLLVLGVLTLLFDGYDSQILAYVMPNVIKEWHLTPVAAGSIVSYGLVGLMIGTAGLGMLADRIGRKTPLILGLLMFSIFNGGLYWVHDFKTFCILRFLAGIGMGGALTINITLASEFAPAKVRARMVATMFTGFMIGPALAGVISILFIPSYGWRVVLFFALLPLIFIPFLYYFLPESVRFLAQKGRHDSAIKVLRRMEKAAKVKPIAWTEESFALPAIERKASVRQLFSSKLAVMTILIWLVYFFNLLAVYGLITWLPTLLMKAGIPLVKSYGYTVMDHFGGFIGAIFLGMVLDRFGRKWGLVSAYVLAAVVSYVFGLATGSPVALYLLSFATGFFVIGGQSAQHAVTGEVYPTFVRSTGVGWALTMGRFGAVCGPLLGGLLQSAGYSFSQYFAFLAIPPLLCAVLVLFYRVNVKGETLEAVEAELTGTGK
jgi:MFS transporter, AAHS family, benzoate transport protein